MRLVPSELAFYERNKISIYLFRYGLCIAFTYFYYVVEGESMATMLIMWAIVPFYWLYNTVRGRITDYLILVLMLYRYCMPLFLYCHDVDCKLVWLVAIAYPICTFIQYGVRGKFGMPEPWGKFFFRNYERRDEFRIWYYLILLIVCVALSYQSYIPWMYVAIPLYFLPFRVASLALTKVRKSKNL